MEPPAPEANGESGAEPLTLRQFLVFFKKYAFLSILLSKLLLETHI